MLCIFNGVGLDIHSSRPLPPPSRVCVIIMCAGYIREKLYYTPTNTCHTYFYGCRAFDVQKWRSNELQTNPNSETRRRRRRRRRRKRPIAYQFETVLERLV